MKDDYYSYFVNKNDIKDCIKIGGKSDDLLVCVQINISRPEIILNNVNPLHFSKFLRGDYTGKPAKLLPKWRVWIREVRQKLGLMFPTTRATLNKNVIALTGLLCVLKEDTPIFKEKEFERDLLDSISRETHFGLFNQFFHHWSLSGFYPSLYLYKVNEIERARSLDSLWMDKYCKYKTEKEGERNRKKFKDALNKELLKIVKIRKILGS